jgi:hypothetical protein
MKLLDILNESPSFYTGPSQEKKTKMVKKVKNVYAALKTGVISVGFKYGNGNEVKYKYVLNNEYTLGIGPEFTIVFVLMDPIKFQLYEIIDGNEWHVDKNDGSNLFLYEKAWGKISEKFKKFDLTLR